MICGLGLDLAKVERPSAMTGRRMTLLLVPKQ